MTKDRKLFGLVQCYLEQVQVDILVDLRGCDPGGWDVEVCSCAVAEDSSAILLHSAVFCLVGCARRVSAMDAIAVVINRRLRLSVMASTG